MSGWEVRVHWAAEPGATAPGFTVHPVEDEDQAIDAAVSVIDGCRHRWAPVKATRAEIGYDGREWRTVASARIRTHP